VNSGPSNGWTVDTLRIHMEALRAAQERFEAERDLRYTEVGEERDRRISEVGVEREKALKIKEEADRAALGLAREIQTYKDEKANELREQINRERGLYATKDDLVAAIREIKAEVKPAVEYSATQVGSKAVTPAMMVSAVMLILAVIAAVVAFVR